MAVIDVVAGARPNFVKIAALFAVADKFRHLQLRLIHTGQHYDFSMSDVFFRDLRLPIPDVYLGVGSAPHAQQTARIMEQYGSQIERCRPDLCLVVGDVNSTLACALVAKKEAIPVAHVEAGLRSFDRSMPEEINRVLTDAISDHLFVTEDSGVENLLREGRPAESIHLVGNLMIDTLLRMLDSAQELHYYREFQLERRNYVYVTLHRPANVDDERQLEKLISQLGWLAQQIPIVFPIHPRTRSRLASLNGIHSKLPRTAHLIEPVGYLQSLCLLANAKAIITDSGGLQEESSALDVPCLTLRDNTERPLTVTHGTNTVVGRDEWELFRRTVKIILQGNYDKRNRIHLWDGKAADRILQIIDADLAAGTSYLKARNLAQ